MEVGAKVVVSLCSNIGRFRKWCSPDGVVFKKGLRAAGGAARYWELVNKVAVLPISRVLGGGLLAWFSRGTGALFDAVLEEGGELWSS